MHMQKPGAEGFCDISRTFCGIQSSVSFFSYILVMEPHNSYLIRFSKEVSVASL